MLAPAFFVTALLYAAVGFGGGSTYSALLVLAKVDFHAIPVVSLLCNLVVVTLGSWRFARAGEIDWRRTWPLFTLSVPLAWAGGRIAVGQLLFVGLLAASLIVAGMAMLWRREPLPDVIHRDLTWREPVIGGVLGLLAGIVGIGGGIFLAKSGAETIGGVVASHWLLFPAVAVGGLSGSMIGSTRLKARHLAVLTAILVLYVGGQLAVRFVTMLSAAA